MIQFLLNIVFSFCTYLLVAISFSVIYYVTKFIHFTHAAIITLGAYLAFLSINRFLPSFFIAALFGIFIVVIIGLAFEIIFHRVMRKKGVSSLQFLIASLGLYVLTQNIISLYFGDKTQTLNNGQITVGHEIFGAYITTIQLITVVVSTVVFVGMNLLYNHTSLGKQIRAVSENAELSGIYGIFYNKIILIVTFFSSALAAIAGLLYAYDTNLTPTMGFNLLLYGIVAMIIGGVGSFKGLLLGSLLLATAQNLVAYYFDTKWMDAATYFILIAFLILRPLGFSGKRLKKVEV